MYAAVIHHDNGVRSWERLHLIKKPFNEISEQNRVERPLNNLAVDHSLVEADCREYGVATIIDISSVLQAIAIQITHRFPRTKNAFRCALVPRIDQARPRYVVRRSTALSSTKTQCSAPYWAIVRTKWARFTTQRSADTRVIYALQR